MELQDGWAVNIGFGISANVPRILLEEGQHGKVTWVIEQGAVGGVPLLDFKFGCASNAEAIMPSPHQFIYFQAGGFDASLLSFLQIDRHGSVNVSKLSARPHVTAGAGGFVDITARAKKIVFSGFFNAGAKLSLANGTLRIDQEGKVKKIVSEVEHISFSGKRAVMQGQDITYVTERCVMKLTPEGLMVTEIAPGVDLERDVLGQSEIPLAVAKDLKTIRSKAVPGRADRSRSRRRSWLTRPSPSRIRARSASITLRRPEKFNALDIPMLDALNACLDQAEAADAVRVVLLRGEGKGFCAGGDIDAWSQDDALPISRSNGCATATACSTDWRGCASRRSPFCPAMRWVAAWSSPRPAISASPKQHVKLGFPETSLGVVPGWSGTQRAVRRFGVASGQAHGAWRRDDPRAAKRWRWALIDRVVETGAGLCRGDRLGRKDRRARAAGHRGRQDDDQHCRGRGGCPRRRSAGQRLHRDDRGFQGRRRGVSREARGRVREKLGRIE